MIPRRKAVQMSLLAGFLPAFFRSAWGAERRSELFEGVRRAGDAGKPLLVVVVPEDRGDWWARGRILGGVLNHGGDEVLAALSLCELVCGNLADVRELTGAGIGATDWLVLVETDRVPAVIRFGADPNAPSVRPLGDDPWAERDAETDAAIRTLRDCVVSMILRDRAAIGRYAAQAEAADPVGADEVRADAGRTPAVVARAPAVLARMAADGEVDAVLAVRTLAEVGRARFVEAVVPGSRWARSSGCGTTVEGDDDGVLSGCGMGYVSPKARRMLYFWEE